MSGDFNIDRYLINTIFSLVIKATTDRVTQCNLKKKVIYAKTKFIVFLFLFLRNISPLFFNRKKPLGHTILKSSYKRKKRS